MITAAIISAPFLFAFHDEDTSLLTAGMPVVFMATGFKFTPQQHWEARAALQTVYASKCYLSQRFNEDLLVVAAGNGTMLLRWPTKESYVADQKTISDPSRPMGICESLGKMRMKLGKMYAANRANRGMIWNLLSWQQLHLPQGKLNLGSRPLRSQNSLNSSSWSDLSGHTIQMNSWSFHNTSIRESPSWQSEF